MRYQFCFNEPYYLEGDDGEGSARARMSSRKSTVSLDADPDDEALLQAVKLMQAKQEVDKGRVYLLKAISLVRIVDISSLHRADAA